MTTSQKLWLGFGSLTLLLVASTMVTLVQVRSIQESVIRQATVTQPFLLSTRELEVNSSKYVLNVRSFLQTDNPVMHKEVLESMKAVDSAMVTYDHLTSTPRQKELSNGFKSRWSALVQFAGQLLDSGTRPISTADSDKLSQLRLALDSYLSGEMQSEALSDYQAQRNATMNYLRTIITVSIGLLIVGLFFALTTGGTVGRAILNSEQELIHAHDDLEKKVEERTRELNVSTEALLRSNHELEQFASVASHDLQEPLRKIQAFGDRLEERCAEQLGDQGKDYLVRILSSAARMRRLIDDLLSFSRVASKAQPFMMTDLGNVISEVISDLEGRLQLSGGRVETGDLPTLEADPMQLQQLFQNLIANGLKFHLPGVPPVVRVQSHVKNLEGLDKRRMVEITVQDNGIGFEEIYLDRIFNVFQRLHGRNEYEGTGMGLAICRKIVVRHGGTITAKSSLGAGSTFIVNLPFQQPKTDPTT